MAKKQKIVYREPSINSPAIKSLKEEIQTLKLKKELSALKGTEKKVQTPENREAREIKELEEKRMRNMENLKKSNEGKGKLTKFLNTAQTFARNASINKDINLRRQTLSQAQAVKTIKSRVEFEKSRSELADMHKKNIITLESLSGMPGNGQRKAVKFEDLY